MSTGNAHIRDACLSVLSTADPAAKAERAHHVARTWSDGGYVCTVDAWPAPETLGAPARPTRPEMVDPGDVPRRRLYTDKGKIALLHAIAHIEFNAIDLAFDLVARFGGDRRLDDTYRRELIDDWIGVGDDEARHFALIASRLDEFGADYGDLPAHNGLWEAAEATRHDLVARLAVAPLLLEARGLDVTPGMIDRLVAADDEKSAGLLRIIYREEVGHVAAGMRWFKHLASIDGKDVVSLYHQMVAEHFKGGLKPPFNVPARQKAGLTADFYEISHSKGSTLA